MATITYESPEHTPLILVLEDVARYQGVVTMTTINDLPTVVLDGDYDPSFLVNPTPPPGASYKVIDITPLNVVVQNWDDELGDGVGENFRINLADIETLRVE